MPMAELTATVPAFRAHSGLERRELLIWFAAALCATNVFKSVAQVPGSGFDAYAAWLSGFSAFHVIAWFAVFRLLSLDTCKAPATATDFGVITALALVNLLPERMTWVAVALFAAYVFWTAARLSTPRAAATVLWALCVQAVVGPLIFNFFSLDFLRADAALVGTALNATQTGFTWHDNIIETAGHSIEVFNGCSSFHNISLAGLCWVTLTKLKRTNWIPTDFLFGSACCVAMIAMNAARIYIMAQSFEAYDYWHNGTGAQIFILSATAVIVLISQAGASLGGQARE